MTFAGMNWLAILIATIAGFAFGAAYYISLSKPWLAAIGKTKEEISAEGKGSPLPFIISIVALAVMAVVLAGTIGHLGPWRSTTRSASARPRSPLSMASIGWVCSLYKAPSSAP